MLQTQVQIKMITVGCIQWCMNLETFKSEIKIMPLIILLVLNKRLIFRSIYLPFGAGKSFTEFLKKVTKRALDTFGKFCLFSTWETTSCYFLLACSEPLWKRVLLKMERLFFPESKLFLLRPMLT